MEVFVTETSFYHKTKLLTFVSVEIRRFLHLHTSTPYTTTSNSTKAPTGPLVGPLWPPPPGPLAEDFATSDTRQCRADSTCTFCGDNPWDLDYT